MAFDPNKPVENSPLDAVEMRGQLNGLKALIDAKPSSADVQQMINTAIALQTAGSCISVDTIYTIAQDPPTASDVQTLIDKVNELLIALKRG